VKSAPERSFSTLVRSSARPANNPYERRPRPGVTRAFGAAALVAWISPGRTWSPRSGSFAGPMRRVPLDEIAPPPPGGARLAEMDNASARRSLSWEF
jgi:hypothetical protein